MQTFVYVCVCVSYGMLNLVRKRTQNYTRVYKPLSMCDVIIYV